MPLERGSRGLSGGMLLGPAWPVHGAGQWRPMPLIRRLAISLEWYSTSVFLACACRGMFPASPRAVRTFVTTQYQRIIGTNQKWKTKIQPMTQPLPLLLLFVSLLLILRHLANFLFGEHSACLLVDEQLLISNLICVRGTADHCLCCVGLFVCSWFNG